MIVLNNLAKTGTCKSVTAMSESGLIMISVSEDNHTELEIVNNISKETNTSHMIGIIDSGVQYSFQAYNNRIRVIRDPETPHRA